MFVRIIDTVGSYLYQPYSEDQPTNFIRVSGKILEPLDIPHDTLYHLKKYIYGLPIIELILLCSSDQDILKARAIDAFSSN